MKRMDSLSAPVKAFVFGHVDGITVKPKCAKITAQHFTVNPAHFIVDRKSWGLTKSHDYYGPTALDPMGL